MLQHVNASFGAYVPNGSIWATIREIAKENVGGQEWSGDQWRRFCEACEVSRGSSDQKLAHTLWQTYRIAKDLLNEGRGDEINWHLKTIREDIDRRLEAPPPMAKLAPEPRRRRVSEDY